MKGAEQAVDAIIRDLSDRGGLAGQWDGIDEEIKDEIRQTWVEIVRKSMVNELLKVLPPNTELIQNGEHMFAFPPDPSRDGFPNNLGKCQGPCRMVVTLQEAQHRPMGPCRIPGDLT